MILEKQEFDNLRGRRRMISGWMERKQRKKLRLRSSRRGKWTGVQVEALLGNGSFFLFHRRAWGPGTKQLQRRHRRHHHHLATKPDKASMPDRRRRWSCWRWSNGVAELDLEFSDALSSLVEFEGRSPGTHVGGGGPGGGKACREGDREFRGGGVRRGAREVLDDSAEIGRVGLDEGGVVGGGTVVVGGGWWGEVGGHGRLRNKASNVRLLRANGGREREMVWGENINNDGIAGGSALWGTVHEMSGIHSEREMRNSKR